MSEHKDPVDRLVDAYDAMLERVHETAGTAENKTLPWLREALEDAREKAVELNELTREEADRISSYVERDIHEAADFIAQTGEEFRDWLNFDMQLMQSKMLDMFATMADQTSVTLKQFADQAKQASLYHTGEITSPGTLRCEACGELLHFEKTGNIPACPKCNETVFKRVPNKS